MTQPMSTNDDFDGLSTDAVNGFRKAQNASIVVNSGDQQSALMSQFLNAATQNNTHNSEDQGIQHVNLTGDSKNVVIVMQQALAQSQEQTQPVLQDLSSITTNNDIMVSSPLTWAKSEILTPEESVSFVTPRQPANRKNVTMVPQQYDNENSEDPMIPNPCLVCGDRASGFHYSVYSCEGCKGFFKRSVQKALNYTCKESASCLINKYSRNSCQYCRFQKCLQIGMKREAVREDRSPGGKHRHKRQCTDDVGGGGGILAQAFDSDDPFRETPQQQQQTTPSYTATHQHAIKLQRLSASSSPTGGSRSPAEHPLLESLLSAKPHLYPKGGTEKTEGLSVNELMQYGYLELRFIIEWAKKVPGFSDLCLADQMSLLKSSFMELNVLRLAYRSMHLDNKIKFAEDVILPLDYCESIGWGRELVDGIIDFAHKLKEISLDLPEFCILNAIILMYPDAQCLEDKMTIANNQSQILDSLRHLLLKRHPCDDKRLGKILLRLPALRTVSAKAAERFLSLTFDGSVELNDLVLEMMN